MATGIAGHDLLCALAERDGNLLRAGPTFTVQIKSNRDPIPYENKYEIEWLSNQENPFFVCVAHRRTLSIDLYSTWNIHNSYLYKRAEQIILVPGNENDEYARPYPPESREQQTVPLGRPILQIGVKDIMDVDKVSAFRKILRDWIEFERQNIVNKQAKMHWIEGPLKYETNHPLPEPREMLVAFYYNAKNLGDCLKNFGRSATDLRITMRRFLGQERENTPNFLEKTQALEQVLLHFSEFLEPTAKEALSNEVGLNFNEGIVS